jgi:hypothetical protein
MSRHVEQQTYLTSQLELGFLSFLLGCLAETKQSLETNNQMYLENEGETGKDEEQIASIGVCLSDPASSPGQQRQPRPASVGQLMIEEEG